MAKLINGNGNPAVYAAEDADLIASIMGDKTSICNLGSKFAATASGANVIEVADGVIITKEGRRIQLDSGSVDEFSIPAGTVGTTNYYIIGYKLYENAQVQQVCETFVQLMPNSTDVIQEDTFKGGATEVYVSLYRVEQDGVNLGTITALLPEIGNISEINADLSAKALVNTYYDTSVNKLYVVNADGSVGGEIKMGSNRCYTFLQHTAYNNIDISELANSDYITITAFYQAGNSRFSERVSVATAKTWVNHMVSAQTNVGLDITYSAGKLNITCQSSNNVIMATINFD